MKTRNFLWGAMGLLAMASCSNDELVSVNHDGDEIAFNVVTNASTRVNADGVYCNNNLPQTFYVWATIENGGTYITGDKIEKKTVLADASQELLTDAGQPRMQIGGGGTGSGYTSWENKSGVRYWPEENVDFYASVNAVSEDMVGYDEHYKFNWNDGVNPTIEVTVPTDVTQQKDLLYAVKKGQSKSDGPNFVNLNFRHALSQVVFKAENTNENLYVKVSGVSICNLSGTNTFTYPIKSTDGNIEDHEGAGNYSDYHYDGSWGTWPELTNGTETYTVSFSPVNVEGTVSLTSANEEGKEFNNNAMLLLPQTTTEWTPSGNIKEGVDPTPDPTKQAGTYFLVKCQIWNVAETGNFNEATDVCLWGKDGAEDIAIPVKVDWKQGKKYIYTFVFDGFGGFNPHPGPNPNPEPVLVPISFDVEVDDFMPVKKDVRPQGVLQLLG